MMRAGALPKMICQSASRLVSPQDMSHYLETVRVAPIWRRRTIATMWSCFVEARDTTAYETPRDRPRHCVTRTTRRPCRRSANVASVTRRHPAYIRAISSPVFPDLRIEKLREKRCLSAMDRQNLMIQTGVLVVAFRRAGLVVPFPSFVEEQWGMLLHLRSNDRWTRLWCGCGRERIGPGEVSATGSLPLHK